MGGLFGKGGEGQRGGGEDGEEGETETVWRGRVVEGDEGIADGGTSGFGRGREEGSPGDDGRREILISD